MAFPAGTPGIVPLAEAKAHLRIETDAEDALLAGLLRSAEAMIEAWVGQLLVRRERVDDGVGQEGVFRLSCGPVERVLSVAVADEAGDYAELSPDGWTLELLPGGRARIFLHRAGSVRVRVTYRAGLADHWNDVPEPLRQAVVRTAAHGFTHRDSPDDQGVPPVVRQMVSAWRNLRLA